MTIFVRSPENTTTTPMFTRTILYIIMYNGLGYINVVFIYIYTHINIKNVRNYARQYIHKHSPWAEPCRRRGCRWRFCCRRIGRLSPLWRLLFPCTDCGRQPYATIGRVVIGVTSSSSSRDARGYICIDIRCETRARCSTTTPGGACIRFLSEIENVRLKNERRLQTEN